MLFTRSNLENEMKKGNRVGEYKGTNLFSIAKNELKFRDRSKGYIVFDDDNKLIIGDKWIGNVDREGYVTLLDKPKKIDKGLIIENSVVNMEDFDKMLEEAIKWELQH